MGQELEDPRTLGSVPPFVLDHLAGELHSAHDRGGNH
jgi:hypothetical protein